MANDAGRATTCKRNFKAAWLQTERTKNEGPSERMSFKLETNWTFQTKNFKNSTPAMEKKTKEPQDPEGKTEQKPMQAVGNKLKQNCKNHSELNCWNSARLELRSQVLTCSTLWKLAWSWHGQWRWQGYQVQAQFQSAMITNRTYKKWRAFWKNELQRGTVWIFQTKKTKNPVIAWRTKEKNHKTLKEKTEHEPCSQEEINWSKIEKKNIQN